jgi:hypothetical protein
MTKKRKFNLNSTLKLNSLKSTNKDKPSYQERLILKQNSDKLKSNWLLPRRESMMLEENSTQPLKERLPRKLNVTLGEPNMPETPNKEPSKLASSDKLKEF